MEQLSRPVIFGTAGHIDHGKTTLVRALTGEDTDRLPEEKARGISIDLGFAHFVLPGGQLAAFIDVPGHEKFIRNMVAGVHGMDAVLLVVAADEGVMPQTREHLDILQLLGVKHGLTVMTKADLVDEDLLEISQEVVREAIASTFLEHSPIYVVDAISGRGLPNLLNALADLAHQVTPRPVEGPARLPIDRVFTVKGFGTVVTGTLVSGQIRLEQGLDVVPGDIPVRVRGIQSHGQALEQVVSGRRVALNLAGIDRSQVERGQVVATPGTIRAVDVMTIRLTLLPSSPEMKAKTRVHIHSGTAETLGRVYFYDRDVLQPGDSTFAELRLETVMPVVRGDRVLLRSYSPVVTIGGGRVIDAGIHHKKREPGLLTTLQYLADDRLDILVEEVLKRAEQPLTVEDVAQKIGVAVWEVQRVLPELSGVLGTDQYLWHVVPRSAWFETVAQDLAAFHETRPLRVGPSREEIRARWAAKWPARAFQEMLEAGPWILDREWVRLSSHKPHPPHGQEAAVEKLYATIRSQGLRPEPLDSWANLVGLTDPELGDALDWLALNGRIWRIDDALYIADEAMTEAVNKIRAALADGPKSTGVLREALNTSRRHAVSILELLDTRRLTRRQGDERMWVGG